MSHSNFTRQTAQKLALLACCTLFFSKIAQTQDILEPPISLGGGTANSVEIYDFDGDGDNDVVRFGTDGQVRWHQNVGGKLGNHQQTKPAIEAVQGYARDFDKDGDRDLIVMRSGQIVWHENLDGKGSFGNAIFMTQGSEFFLEDLDGDGDFDVLPQQTANGSLTWFKNLGNSLPFEAATITYDPTWSDPAMAAAQKNFSEISVFDNDQTGRVDILGNAPTNVPSTYDNLRYQVSRIKNLGGGNFVKSLEQVHTYYNFSWGARVSFLKPIDLDADGKREVAALTTISGLMLVQSQLTSIDGNFKNFDVIYVSHDGSNGQEFFKDFLPIDMDGNGKNEMVAIKHGSFKYYPNYPDATGATDFIYRYAGYKFDSPTAKGDIDGDGKDEFFCVVNGQLSIFKRFFKLTYKFQVKGSVFLDKNENGQKDLGEPNLNDHYVSLSPSLHSAISQDSTGFNIVAEKLAGTTLTCKVNENWDFTTASSIPFNFSNDTLVQVDFGLKPKKQASSASIDLTSAPPRCGQEVPFWLTIKNQGTQVFEGLLALEYKDSLTTFVKATPQPDSVSGSTYFWKIKHHVPTHLQKITITNKIAGAINFGKFIYFVPSLQVFDSTGGIQSIKKDYYKQEIRCSFDPNDKLMYPDKPGNNDQIYFLNDIEYTIRFQNTGNDTAFLVRILDQLDADLDWSSLRVIGASHKPFSINIDERGLLLVEFPNIQLPDSSTNFQASNGFFKFTIRPKKTGEISNQAQIFFDANSPITTNSVKITAMPNPFIFKIEKLCATKKEGSVQVTPTIVAEGNLEYDWGFATGANVLIPKAGDYPLTVKLDGEVIYQITLTVESEKITGSVSTLPTSANNDGWVKVYPSGAGAPFTYQWDTPNANTTQSVGSLPAGTYHCTVTNQFGCSAVFTAIVTSLVSDEEPTAQSLPKLEVSPNPNAGSFQLKISNLPAADFKVEISNSLGILEKTFQPQDFQKSANFLEINDLEAGLHFVSLKIGSQRVVKKVVVLR